MDLPPPEVGETVDPLAPPAAAVPRHSWPMWVGLLFAAGFLLHASNYLYFFVDDEAISYVYAQNVLNGKGLVYDSFEGQVEGYSNFLHVWIGTGILAVIRMLDANKLNVFVIGTLISLVAGAGLLLTTFLTLRKLPQIRAPGALTGLAFLALAGPLAVWSCSSLETATFGFLISVLIFLLVSHVHDPRSLWAAVGCTVAVLLMRLDGVVYVGAILAGVVVFAERPVRRDIWKRVVLPAAALFAVYQIWRIAYFRELLSMPIYAKVMYKLLPQANLVTKPPEHNYAAAFFQLYGMVPLAVLCTASLLWTRDRLTLACLMSAALLVAYLAVVGDWMFGFRFFVSVLPLLAILIASSVSAVSARARPVGWALAAVCVVWFGNVAYGFGGDYTRAEGRESWLVHPSLDPQRRFSRYYSLFQELERYARPGDRTAFNQAGFLPFMLDLDNIDDLGICSKFFAKLPTKDIFLTEVGRYEPLTNKPVFRAGEAYLLYREPRFLIAPEDLLLKANQDEIPPEVLGGFYRLLFRDASHNNVVYERTAKSVSHFKTQSRHFLENVVHVSYLRRAYVNDAAVPEARFGAAFPWLRDGRSLLQVRGVYRISLTFADRDEPIYEFHIDQLLTNAPVTFVVTLRSSTGVTYRRVLELEANRPRDFREHLPDPVLARTLDIEIAGAPHRTSQLWIGDMRVQGQTAALAAYIQQNLRFPAP